MFCLILTRIPTFRVVQCSQLGLYVDDFPSSGTAIVCISRTKVLRIYAFQLIYVILFILNSNPTLNL